MVSHARKLVLTHLDRGPVHTTPEKLQVKLETLAGKLHQDCPEVIVCEKLRFRFFFFFFVRNS